MDDAETMDSSSSSGAPPLQFAMGPSPAQIEMAADGARASAAAAAADAGGDDRSDSSDSESSSAFFDTEEAEEGGGGGPPPLKPRPSPLLGGAERVALLLPPSSPPPSNAAADAPTAPGRPEDPIPAPGKERAGTTARRASTRGSLSGSYAGDYGTSRIAPRPASYESMMSAALNNAGRWAYGVVAIEVWAMDPQTQRLDRVPGGYWRCPYYPKSDAVSRLEEEDHPRYMPPVPLQPGVGFVGSLWAEGSFVHEYVEWRNLRAMIMDPDQPRIPRTDCLAEAFGMAAGMPFRVGNGSGLEHKGVVVYYTRHTVNRDAVSTETNLRFLRSATDLIGSVSSFRVPREDAVKVKQDRTAKSMRSVIAKCQALAMFRSAGVSLPAQQGDTFADSEDIEARGGTGGGGGRRISSMIRTKRFSVQNLRPQDHGALEQEDKKESCASSCRRAVKGAVQSLRCKDRLRSAANAASRKKSAWTTKVRGGDILPPPGLPGTEAAFALLGIMICLMTLSGANEAIQRWGGHDRSMILSAFGGLVVNLFCLPASPNSQPRNAFFGLTINVFIGMAFRRIPEAMLPLWIRGAISPAVSVSLMAYLGYIHPPAGGAAVAFALGKDDEWLELGLLLFGWTLSVTFAVFYNNLSEKRAYPNYWRFLWMPDAFYRRLHRWKKRRRDRLKSRRESDEMVNLSRHIMESKLVKEYIAEVKTSTSQESP